MTQPTYAQFFYDVMHGIADRSAHFEITDELDLKERVGWWCGWASIEEPPHRGAANNPLNTELDRPGLDVV